MPSSPVAESRVLSSAMLVVASLVLGACSGGPSARLYILDASAAPAVAWADRGIKALGVGTVSLPGYASDPRIASRDDRNEVSVDDGHRWAEEPEDALTRALAERLRAHAGATVLVQPWARNFAPDARVEIAFDRLLRDPAGGIDAAGQIRLLSGDGRDVIDVRPFELSRPARSTRAADWFDAVAELVDDLARLAVDTLGTGVT